MQTIEKIDSLNIITDNFPINLKNNKNAKTNIAIATINNKKITIDKSRSNMWFYLASNWVIILAFLISLYVIPSISEEKLIYVILSIFLMTFILFIISLLTYWFFGLILNFPILGNWWLTYLLIAILPIIIWYTIKIFIKD